jgi:hypothetical protein
MKKKPRSAIGRRKSGKRAGFFFAKAQDNHSGFGKKGKEKESKKWWVVQGSNLRPDDYFTTPAFAGR